MYTTFLEWRWLAWLVLVAFLGHQASLLEIFFPHTAILGEYKSILAWCKLIKCIMLWWCQNQKYRSNKSNTPFQTFGVSEVIMPVFWKNPWCCAIGLKGHYSETPIVQKTSLWSVSPLDRWPVIPKTKAPRSEVFCP